MFTVTSKFNGITTTKQFPFIDDGVIDNEQEQYRAACYHLAQTSIETIEGMIYDSLFDLGLPLGDILYHLRDLQASVIYWDDTEYFNLSSFPEAYNTMYEEFTQVCSHMMAKNTFEIQLTSI